MVKAIIFDMDGTLLDSTDAWEGLPEAFLNEIGVKSEANLQQAMETMSTDESAAYLIKKYDLEYSIVEVKKIFYNLIKGIYKEDVELKAGVGDYLQAALLKGLDMCIVTAASRAIVEIVLERFELESYFKFIMTLDEEGLNKRSPEIYIIAANKLAYERDQIIVFEDSLHAVKSAKKADFKVIGVYDESSSKDGDEMREIVDAYIYDFKDEILEL